MGFVANYLRNLGAVARGRQPRRPLLFSYYVTHRCDLGCRYCCDGDGRRFREDPVPELTTDEARRLVDLLRGSADTLDITGGEPMARPDLEAILAHARGAGFRTVLNTKGIGLRDRPDLLRFSDVLVISVDSLDADRLARVLGRPAETARRVLDAVDFALARGAAAGTGLVLSAVATPENLDDVSGVLRFAVGRGIGFHLSPEIVGTRANPALRGNPRYEALVGEALAAKRAGASVLGVRRYLEGIRDFSSFACHPMLMPVIRPDGRLYYPCLESRQAEVSLLEAGSYEAALAASRARRGEIPPCRDCCHLFCHMALSLLQRHPLAALREARAWGRLREASAGRPGKEACRAQPDPA